MHSPTKAGEQKSQVDDEQTPIQKTAAVVVDALVSWPEPQKEWCKRARQETIDSIVGLMCRTLDAEVPEAVPQRVLPNRAGAHEKELAARYNQCRRDFGLRDGGDSQ